MEAPARNLSSSEGRLSARTLAMGLLYCAGMAVVSVTSLKRAQFPFLADIVFVAVAVLLLVLVIRWAREETRIGARSDEPTSDHRSPGRPEAWLYLAAMAIWMVALLGWPRLASPFAGLDDIDFRLTIALGAVAALAALFIVRATRPRR